jgi:hypothetical protein
MKNCLSTRFTGAIAAVLLGLVATVHTASANVVTFDSLAGPNGATFTSVTEDGITVTSTAGLWQHGFNVGNPVPSIFSFDQVASIEVTTGGVFNFESFDLGTGGGSNPNWEFYGYLNNVLVHQGGNNAPGNTFVTISGEFFVPIDRLVITTTLTSSSANLDNIRVTPLGAVPDAANTSAMVLLGLVALVAARRRMM